MKALLINTSETKGGAAVACKRLAVALQKQGVDVSLLVRDKNSSDSFVSSVNTTPFHKILSKIVFYAERLQIFLANKFSRKNLFTVSTASTGINILNHPLVKEADIIHLHWINQGLLSVHEIGELIKLGKPVIWTMHDMWPVTGICHYSGDCSRYTESCGCCPFLQNSSPSDLSYRIFKQKKAILQGAGVQFVACSQWLRQRAEVSTLRSGNFFKNIPNPIDTERYIPGNKKTARQELNLPLDKKLLLFGAFITSDKRKGLEYLIKATHLLADLSDKVEIVFCGEVKEEFKATLGLKAHSLGYLSETSQLIKMYQSVDCYVIPSLEENLPNMIMEAMACGVPCVGFKTGGIPEMIAHQQNGYLAQYRSAEDLAQGIRFTLEKNEDATFGQAVRDFILTNYAESIVAQKYVRLYEEALRNNMKNKPYTTR